MAKRAVIYVRTATRTGADPGAIQRQLEQCQEFAARQGWEVVREYSDTASGTAPRPGLEAVMHLTRGCGCDVLVAHSASRLTRDASELASILSDADASDDAVVTADRMLDTSAEPGVMAARTIARFTARRDDEAHCAPAR